MHKTLSLVKLLHIVQDSMMKNCIPCLQDSRSIFISLLHKQYLNLHTELASLHNWRPIFKRRPHFVYLTLHCAVRHAYVVPAIHQNHKGLSCSFSAENNVLNFKSFCTHKQPCLWAQCSKQVCLPAQNCMWTNLGWSSSKNLVWNVLILF